MTKYIRIQATENGVLVNILPIVVGILSSQASDLMWYLYGLDLIVDSNKGDATEIKNAIELSRNANGYGPVSINALNEINDKTVQIIEGVFCGSSKKAPHAWTTSFSSLCKVNDVVIECFDSSYWDLFIVDYKILEEVKRNLPVFEEREV